MKTRYLLIFLLILISIVPAYYINGYLQRVIKPRQSLFQLLLYFLSGFVLVFVYTNLIVRIILWLFPLPLK